MQIDSSETTVLRSISDEAKKSPNQDSSNEERRHDQLKYQAKFPNNKVFTIRRDTELGIWYRPAVSGFALRTGFLSEDDRNFIRILTRHNRLSNSRIPLSQKIIQEIVNDVDYDSDLWDDIFDSDEIFRPVYSAKDPNKQDHHRRKKENIDYHLDEELLRKFKNMTDCKKYIRTRIEVFKVYIYLRRCAILYRDSKSEVHKQPLLDLLSFLSDKANLDWLKSKLRVKAVSLKDENWNSGLHEWLTCEKTVEAIRRTAGMVEGVQSCLTECIWASTNSSGKEIEYYCSEFNWLDMQLLLRTPNKFVIFKSDRNMIEGGHGGAVNIMENPSKATVGVCKKATAHTISEAEFHDRLNCLFDLSRNVNDFFFCVHLLYEGIIFHDQTPVCASKEKRYLVNGTRTDNIEQLRAFQSEKLVTPHQFFIHCGLDLETQKRIAREATLLAEQQASVGLRERLEELERNPPSHAENAISSSGEVHPVKMLPQFEGGAEVAPPKECTELTSDKLTL